MPEVFNEKLPSTSSSSHSCSEDHQPYPSTIPRRSNTPWMYAEDGTLADAILRYRGEEQDLRANFVSEDSAWEHLIQSQLRELANTSGRFGLKRARDLLLAGSNPSDTHGQFGHLNDVSFTLVQAREAFTIVGQLFDQEVSERARSAPRFSLIPSALFPFRSAEQSARSISDRWIDKANKDLATLEDRVLAVRTAWRGFEETVLDISVLRGPDVVFEDSEARQEALRLVEAVAELAKSILVARAL